MACVVVAEDNVEHRTVIAEVVRRLGHEVVPALDGQTGLNAVAEHRPGLVIADVDMPRMDGLQLCRRIREDPVLHGTPVMLITAYIPPSDPQLSRAGATVVIRKPFTITTLTEVIRKHLDDPAAICDGEPRTVAPGPPGPVGDATRRTDPSFVDALLRSLDTGVVACDTAGRLVVFNEALQKFFGADAEGVPLQQWAERFVLRHHDGTALRTEELPLIRALAGEQVQQSGMLACDRSGRPRWFAVNANPVRDDAGTVLGAVAAVHDITAEHLAQRYQNCKTEVLRVLASTPDADTAGQEVLRAIAVALGWPHTRLWLVDRSTDVLRAAAVYTAPGQVPPVLPERIVRGEGIAGRCWQRGELQWVPDIHAPDSPLLAEVAASSTYRAAGAFPVRRGDTTIGVATFFCHDRQEPDPALAVLLTGVAGNVGAYLEQRRAEELALQLAATTDAYIALVGHELRTPLTSIASYAELIAESSDDTRIGEVRDLLDVVLRNTATMRCLVERLLDLAALESGHAELKRASLDLAEIVRDAVTAARPAADRRHLAIRADVPAPVPVMGDAGRLRQVVDQLLDNAVKYTPEGGAPITVTLGTDAEDGGGAGLTAVLSITDTGIGIPAGEEPQLLRRLYRAGNARHTGIPGAGLGLATSRAILEHHHGTIALTAAAPAGTTVTVRLPASM